MDIGERLRNARAWLFDMDGTLVEQRVDFALMRRQVLALAERNGLDVTGTDSVPVLEAVRMIAARAADRPGVVECFEQDSVNAIEQVELMAVPGATVLPGVADLLGVLAAKGLPVGVVTRNCRAAALRILATNDIGCDCLVAREDAPRVKPDPAHLQVALDAFGVGGNAAVMCGDYVLDIEAGRNAGAVTVGVLGDRDASLFDAVAPDLVVKGLGELIAWVQ